MDLIEDILVVGSKNKLYFYNRSNFIEGVNAPHLQNTIELNFTLTGIKMTSKE